MKNSPSPYFSPCSSLLPEVAKGGFGPTGHSLKRVGYNIRTNSLVWRPSQAGPGPRGPLQHCLCHSLWVECQAHQGSALLYALFPLPLRPPRTHTGLHPTNSFPSFKMSSNVPLYVKSSWWWAEFVAPSPGCHVTYPTVLLFMCFASYLPSSVASSWKAGPLCFFGA